MQPWTIGCLLLLLTPFHSKAAGTDDAGATGPSGPVEPIEFQSVDNGVIRFSGLPKEQARLSSLKTELHDLAYLGKLMPTDGKLPYFVFTGKPCANCDDEKNIYLIRPGARKPDAFVFPGRITDPKTHELLFEARAFFGKCLPGSKSDVYLAHQREKIDRRHGLQASVFVAEPQDSYIKEDLREKALPRLKDIQSRVKAKACVEITGWNRPMTAKSISLKARHEADDDEDEDGNDEKAKEIESP